MERFQAEVLVEESGPLVRWVIARYFPTFMRRWYDDMYSVGLVATWQAALAYQPLGKTWASWAVVKVAGAISHHLRQATGKRLVLDSPKRAVSLQALMQQEDGHDWPDRKQPPPGRAAELQDMRARLKRRLGRDYIILEGILEDRPLAEAARRMGISEGGACNRRKKLFDRIRAGDHGELIEV